MKTQFRLYPRWQRLTTCLLLLAVALLNACQPIQPVAESAAAEPQSVVIEVTADGLKVPDEIPSGIVTVTYKNSSDKSASPGLGWMQEGHTIVELDKAVQAEDFMTMLKIGIPAGQVSLEPGASREATYNIKAGEIYIENFANENGPELKPNKTTGVSTMATPTADYKLEMADFAFIMPDEITAGKHIWEIRNTGKQIHEVGILKLNDGVTVEDLIKLASSQEPPSGPPPFEQIPTDGVMGSGVTSWVTLDIPAGEYTVICFLPNVDDEKMSPHIAHGMVRQLVVK